MAPCDLNVRWTYLRLRQERHKAIESVMFARRKRWFDRIMKTNKGDRNERLSAEGCYRGRGLHHQADCAELLPTLGGLMR
jgi:hypothetical protein